MWNIKEYGVEFVLEPSEFSPVALTKSFLGGHHQSRLTTARVLSVNQSGNQSSPTISLQVEKKPFAVTVLRQSSRQSPFPTVAHLNLDRHGGTNPHERVQGSLTREMGSR